MGCNPEINISTPFLKFPDGTVFTPNIDKLGDDKLRRRLAGESIPITGLTDDIVFVDFGEDNLAFGREHGELKVPTAEGE